MPDFVSSLFQAVKGKRPILSGLLDRHGQKSLKDFANDIQNKAEFPSASVQGRDDFIDASFKTTERTLGRDVAGKLKAALQRNSNILTANHHCANISDLPVQGTINFSLASQNDAVIPVFAFGDVPLNNSRYPRGILFADNIKLPIFPERYKNTLVTSCPSFRLEFVENAVKRLRLLYDSNAINSNQFKSATSFLENFYMDKDVLACDDYSTQALLLSSRIWKSLFAQSTVLASTELAHIEIEKIVTELLKSDLFNSGALIYNILFDRELRDNTLATLNLCPGCWDILRLYELAASESDRDDNSMLAGAGTFFFWGVDEKGRRVPLVLSGLSGKYLSLKSINPNDNLSIPFDSDSLIMALESKRIIPGLFLSFAAIAFARGYKCHGGFMQVDYLTKMKHGLTSALYASAQHKWADSIASVATENYSAGMIFALFEKNDGELAPAGAVEIASKGGLAPCDFEKLETLSLNEANIPGLPAVYKTVFRPDERDRILSGLTVSELIKCNLEKFVIIR